jgi:hypothetical protein
MDYLEDQAVQSPQMFLSSPVAVVVVVAVTLAVVAVLVVIEQIQHFF